MKGAFILIAPFVFELFLTNQKNFLRILFDTIREIRKIRPVVWQQANAGIAQLVEHDLAKVGVASSSLVSRSNLPEWWNR